MFLLFFQTECNSQKLLKPHLKKTKQAKKKKKKCPLTLLFGRSSLIIKGGTMHFIISGTL